MISLTVGIGLGPYKAPTKVIKYPAFYFNGKQGSGHIWSYTNFVGPIPFGEKCCHSCDNTHCVNPDHLFAGNQSINLLDASRKNRTFSWKKNGNKCPAIVGILKTGKYKLSVKEVTSIRKRHAAGELRNELAENFAVHVTTINRIVTKKSWNFI